MAERTNDDTTSKVSSVWQRISNPLLGLNAFEIDRLLTMARQGMDVRLQSIYALVEEQTPIFSVCLEKRQAGLLQRKWDIEPIDPNDSSGVEQSKRVMDVFVKSDELSENSLTDAFRRLQQGAFRGRSYVKPFISESGELTWRPLENWNVLRAFNRNWWNPTANQPMCVAFDYGSWKRDSGLVEIPKDEVCYTLYERPIDVPGVMVYLRQLVGETKWAQFVERNGNPQVILTAPEGTPDSNLGLWNQRAMQIQNGASGVLPNGSDVKELVEGRGQDPFSEFVKHQEEVICILAVGGALNTLGGATGLGSNLADKQDSQFQSLVSLDAKKIQNTINNVAVEKVCRKILGQ